MEETDRSDRDERIADEHSVKIGGGRDFDESCRPHDEDRQRDDEPRDRPGGGDIEERAPRGNGTANPDDRTERPDQERRSGDEERQSRRNPVVTAGEVVTHLVGAEDEDEEERVRDTVRESRRRQELRPGSGDVARVLPPPASGHAGGDECREKEHAMKPGTPAGLRRYREVGDELGRRESGDLVAQRAPLGKINGTTASITTARCPRERTDWPPWGT